MSRLDHKLHAKNLRKKRVRANISGTADKPRLSITISNLHVSAQLIDDSAHKTIASATTVGKKISGDMTHKAATIGDEIAKKAKKAKVNQVVVDRNGRRYAKRLSALVDALRQEGIKV